MEKPLNRILNGIHCRLSKDELKFQCQKIYAKLTRINEPRTGRLYN